MYSGYLTECKDQHKDNMVQTHVMIQSSVYHLLEVQTLLCHLPL